MHTLHLAAHAYVCVTEDGGVILDLRRDKYLGIGNDDMKALAQEVFGWPRPRSSPPAENLQARHPISRQLVDQGVLTQDACDGKTATPVTVPWPHSVLIEPEFEDWHKFRSLDVLRFLSSWTAVVVGLRTMELAQIAHRIARRKAGAMLNNVLDIEAVKEITARYLRMRALAFTARDACLFDSLVLLEFLAKYSIFPTWVLGVQTGPFKAHSWVQINTFVLNDTPERVRAYSPILAL